MESCVPVIREWSNKIVGRISIPIWESKIKRCRVIDVECRPIEIIDNIGDIEINLIKWIEIKGNWRISCLNPSIRVNSDRSWIA